MNHPLTKVLFLILSIPLLAGSVDDKSLIKQTIIEGYIEGIISEGNVEKVRKAWHKECDIVILTPKGLRKLPASYWVKRLTEKPGPIETDVSYEFKSIHITGRAALAIVKVFYKGKPKYMDYMSLYKFPEGWKIATKIYHDYGSK